MRARQTPPQRPRPAQARKQNRHWVGGLQLTEDGSRAFGCVGLAAQPGNKRGGKGHGTAQAEAAPVPKRSDRESCAVALRGCMVGAS